MTDRVLPFSTAAQAYRAAQPLHVRPVAHVRPVERQPSRDTLDISAAAKARTQPANPLAAAKVPGQVSFAGATPAKAAGALPIYAHPADRNAAATSISAGRLIDTQA
jgi:hypothetical protein